MLPKPWRKPGRNSFALLHLPDAEIDKRDAPENFCFMHSSYVELHTLGWLTVNLRCMIQRAQVISLDLFILPSSVNTAGRRGVFLHSITVHNHILTPYYRMRGSSKTGANLLVVSGWWTC